MGRLFRTRPGHRGLFLMFLALLDGVYAWALINTSAPQQHAEDLLLPWDVWAGIWAFVGLTCLAGAFASRDRVSFALAAAIKFTWAAVSLVGWIQGSQPNGWLSAVVWGSFSATVLIISDWPEPSPPPRVPDLPERFQHGEDAG